MAKLKLTDYIHLLDRMLEREGLAQAERDAVFNDPDNTEMISVKFRSKTHPKEVFKELDRRPVEMMYASLEESMKELGYVNEEETSELSDGQKYAINFLKAKGLKFVSTPRQLKRGTLMFEDPNDIWSETVQKNYFGQVSGQPSFRHWALYRTGYVRTGDGQTMEVRGRIKPPQYEQTGFIDDDEWMDLAHLASGKINSIRKRKDSYDPKKADKIRKHQQRLSVKRIKDLEKQLNSELRGMSIEGGSQLTDDERKEAVKNLYQKYFPE